MLLRLFVVEKSLKLYSYYYSKTKNCKFTSVLNFDYISDEKNLRNRRDGAGYYL
jgi:hypothetical protein